MKKQILFFGLFLLFIQSMYGNDGISSKIVFYREPNYVGSAVSYKVFVGDSAIIKLKNNSYYSYSCLPGEYDIQIGKLQETKLRLKVEQGKTYYLRFGIRIGVWSSIPELLLVDSVSAYPAINSGSMRKLDKQNTPFVRPKNRLGLNLNIGGGFEGSTMARTITGENSTISSGGGYAIGLKYGHEFNRHFDVAIDFNYQFSQLRPFLNNAEVTFGRGVLSITPSYIVPIDGGDAMRLKFGAGIDGYLGPKMEMDLSQLYGLKDTWTYKNSVGYHLSAIFEWNIADNWSLNYGLKWYNVSYSFEKGNNSYPIVDKLTNPNGSGIDFLMGFYYHF